MSAFFRFSDHDDGTESTKALTGTPRKSDADWRRDLRMSVVHSAGVRCLVTGIGSERGVGAIDAAGVPDLDWGADGNGVGAGWRTWTA